MSSPDNPRLISFTDDRLKVEVTVNFNRPEIDNLTPEQRALFEEVVRTQTLVLSLALMLKPDIDSAPEPKTSWEDHLKGIIDNTRETIWDLEGEINDGNLSERLLGFRERIVSNRPSL